MKASIRIFFSDGCFFVLTRRKYYDNNCEPLNIIGWSLGGCILVEVLNAIYLINKQLNEKDKIKVGKIIMLSPAWYIIDPKNFIKSHVDDNFYSSSKAEKINELAEKEGMNFILHNPLSLWHLLKISSYSKNKTNFINTTKDSLDGLSILKDYDTMLIVPQNDG